MTVNHREVEKVISLDAISDARTLQLSRAQRALEEMHKDVQERTDAVRRKQVDRHNEKTHVRNVNFEQGDFVLRARPEQLSGPKLSFRLKGPLIVKRFVSDYLVEVEDLRTEKTSVAVVANVADNTDN